MKSDELRKAIGGIDDDLIEASETAGKTGRTIISWTRWGTVAAALVCIITAAVIVPGMLTENVPVTVPDRQQSDIGNIAGRDTAGGEAKNISEAVQTYGEAENGTETDIEKVQIPETEPVGEKNGNPDVKEAGPGRISPAGIILPAEHPEIFPARSTKSCPSAMKRPETDSVIP